VSLFERIYVVCRACAPPRVEQLTIGGHRKPTCEKCGRVFDPMEQAVHYMGPLVVKKPKPEPEKRELSFRPKESDFEFDVQTAPQLGLRSGSKAIPRSEEILVRMRTEATLVAGQPVTLLGPATVGGSSPVQAVGIVREVCPDGTVLVGLRQ
jgi:hypothetical protein